MPDLLEQLRSYGEAVEAEAVRIGDRDPVVVRPWWRRPVVLVAAAVLAVVALGGTAMRLIRTSDEGGLVRTLPATRPDGAATTTPEPSPTTTAGNDATTTTTAPPRLTIVRGVATWTGAPDDRATVLVAACLVGDSGSGCPSQRSTAVSPDGSFELSLPRADSPQDWKVAAAVDVGGGGGTTSCIFSCDWRTAMVGPATTISDAAPPDSLRLSVAARVVGVYVRDRNGQTFQGGAVMVGDTRCTQSPCPDGQSKVYSLASSTDGAALIVVDPSATYDLSGVAQNTGWPNPEMTLSNGNTWWDSATVRAKGSAIPEGQTFLVDGAPA